MEGAHYRVGKQRTARIMERLNAAEAFEKFLATKYLGQKRFGLEGAESLIPILDALLEEAHGEHQAERQQADPTFVQLNIAAVSMSVTEDEAAAQVPLAAAADVTAPVCTLMATEAMLLAPSSQ